jgi:hypothetical protein
MQEVSGSIPLTSTKMPEVVPQVSDVASGPVQRPVEVGDNLK